MNIKNLCEEVIKHKGDICLVNCLPDCDYDKCLFYNKDKGYCIDNNEKCLDIANKWLKENCKKDDKMEFKVGDKIKYVYDTPFGILEQGKIYTITNIIDYNKETFLEIEGEYMLKQNSVEKVIESNVEVSKVGEKTFREVIADIKEGEIWEGKHFVINIESDGVLTIKTKDGSNLKTHGIYIEGNFTLQLSPQIEEYTFAEAFKAYEEGKEIEGVYSGRKYKKDPNMNMLVNNEYFESCKPSLSFLEVSSKWYINN